MTTVAFIGLGAMGWPLAGHLAKAMPTLVCTRTADKAARHASEFGSRAVTLDHAASADVLITCLPTSADVDDVVHVVLDRLHAGALWIDHTSGVPASARATAGALADEGVAYVDACLSGGVPGAVAARTTVMFGGATSDVERAKEYVGVYASTMVRVGDVGAGHAVKAINNALLAVHLWSLGEGLLALSREGVDAALALEVINASSGRSNSSENLAPERIVTRSFTNTFALGLLAKDLGIATGVIDEAHVPAPMLRQMKELVDIARHELGSDVDHTAVVRMLEQWAGSQIR